MKKPVEKAYNSGQWSRACYFGFIRSGLRRMSVRWGPKNECLKDARLPYKGANKRRKWKYRCGKCGKWFASKEIRVHHKLECGALKCYDDLPGFVQRLFCEKAGFIAECISCHDKEHKESKK